MVTQKELLQRYEELDLEKLPVQFQHDEDIFQLVQRVREKCLYKRIWNGQIIGYVVFKVQIVPYRSKMKRFYKFAKQSFDPEKYREYKETFPKPEDFGTKAWDYVQYPKALIQFNKI